MAKTLWPQKEALGQCIKVNADTMPCTYVVGVAENIKANSLTEDTGLYYYMPTAQFQPQNGGLFIRTRGKSADVSDAIRRELQREMPWRVVRGPSRRSPRCLGSQMSSWKLGATMFVAFGNSRTDAGRHRDVQRDRLQRGAAQPRDGSARGAWRAGRICTPRRARRREARGHWCRNRAR